MHDVGRPMKEEEEKGFLCAAAVSVESRRRGPRSRSSPPAAPRRRQTVAMRGHLVRREKEARTVVPGKLPQLARCSNYSRHKCGSPPFQVRSHHQKQRWPTLLIRNDTPFLSLLVKIRKGRRGEGARETMRMYVCVRTISRFLLIRRVLQFILAPLFRISHAARRRRRLKCGKFARKCELRPEKEDLLLRGQ